MKTDKNKKAFKKMVLIFLVCVSVLSVAFAASAANTPEEQQDELKLLQQKLDRAMARGEAGYTGKTDDSAVNVSQIIADDTEERIRQQQEAQKEAEKRAEIIKAYRSSPIIPFDPWQYAGLKIGKTKKDDHSTQLQQDIKKNAEYNDTAIQKGTWNRFLNRKDAALAKNEIYSVLNSGTVIPAMLISGVNSDLPGNMLAQVSANVYDSPTGKRVLIPQGSRLFGLYDSKVIFGQKRPLIKWTRLIYPDGSTLDIENMPGADRRGYAGFKAKVNSHYWPMVTSAALVSLFAAAADYFDDNKVIINQPNISIGTNSLPVGSCVAWNSFKIPDGYLLCDGSTYDTSVYSDLYNALGKDTLPDYESKSSDSETGTIAAFPGTIPPAGYLECDGSTFDSEKYPKLAQLLGGNRLPDYRGVFLRGWNHGRGDGKGDTDQWRYIGSYQDFATAQTGGGMKISDGYPAAGTTGPFIFGSDENNLTHIGTLGGNSNAEETRPRNVAVMYCIKAGNADEMHWIIKAIDNTSRLVPGIATTNSADGSSNRSTVGRELGRTLQHMAQQILAKYLEVAPTLTVKPGYKFSVIVNKEIELPVKTIK